MTLIQRINYEYLNVLHKRAFYYQEVFNIERTKNYSFRELKDNLDWYIYLYESVSFKLFWYIVT